MIGLESSGFTICVGLILLLTGIVMYYCKKKITQCEHKIDSMFTLVSAINVELSILKQQNNINSITRDEDESLFETTPLNTHPYQELIPPRSEEHNNEVNDSSESESDNEDDNDIISTEIKVVDLGVIEELDVIDSESGSEELDVIDSESGSEELESDSDNNETEFTDVINYNKLQVSALRKLVTERQLSTGVSKLRKQELVALLQK